MKLIGYCTGCRKVKRVRVSGNALLMAEAHNEVVQGLCDDCDSKTEKQFRIERKR